MRILLFRAVKDRRGALGGVAVFVEIGGNCADAFDAEIPGRELDAFQFGKGVQVTTDAGVYVEPSVRFHREVAERRDWIDEAVGEAGR